MSGTFRSWDGAPDHVSEAVRESASTPEGAERTPSQSGNTPECMKVRDNGRFRTVPYPEILRQILQIAPRSLRPSGSTVGIGNLPETLLTHWERSGAILRTVPAGRFPRAIGRDPSGITPIRLCSDLPWCIRPRRVPLPATETFRNLLPSVPVVRNGRIPETGERQCLNFRVVQRSKPTMRLGVRSERFNWPSMVRCLCWHRRFPKPSQCQLRRSGAMTAVRKPLRNLFRIPTTAGTCSLVIRLSASAVTKPGFCAITA